MGSHCDGDSETCAWSCLSDSECGDARRCDASGVCSAAAAGLGAGAVNVANDAPACAGVDPVELRHALLELNASHTSCDEAAEHCPCGSYCSGETGECQVECLPSGLAADPQLTCTGGNVCNPFGRCVAAPAPGQPPGPGPRIELSIELDTALVRADTTTSAQLVPVNVTLVANSVDVVDQQAARVRFGFAEIRMFRQGRSATAGTPLPRVKCSASASLEESCVLDHGWIFNLAPGHLRSNPRTVWIELPQSTDDHEWMFEARSDWAADAAQATVRTQRTPRSPTDPGHYVGNITLDGDQLVPVEAVVTETHVALFEPTRVLLPTGHAVLARDPGKVTIVPWLSAALASGTVGYDVQLQVTGSEYDPAIGELQIDLSLLTGATDQHAAQAVLRRTGDSEAATCTVSGSCEAGTYCNTTMSLCLPGAEAPPGSIASLGAPRVAELRSPLVAGWSPAVAAIRMLNSSLGTGGLSGVQRAYCFESGAQVPARFGVVDPTKDLPALDPVSNNALCRRGGGASTEYVQPAFNFENREVEAAPATPSAAAFDLFESCKSDLKKPPGIATDTSDCASLWRFLVAMTASSANGVGQPLDVFGQRLVMQILRQWLALHAYVAHTAVQDRAYDDALGAVSQPAYERLGSSVDLIEQGLRVMLDPLVRPQYATGPALAKSIATPDFRLVPRPVDRWTFSEGTATSVPDVEGAANLTISNVTVANGKLIGNGVALAQCVSATEIGLPPSRFTIVGNPSFISFNGSFKLFEKTNAAQQQLTVRATTINPLSSTPSLRLTVADWVGRSVTFPDLALNGRSSWGLIAIVADGTSYKLYRSRAGLLPPAGPDVVDGVVSAGGAPQWGSPGRLSLACNLPTPGTCTSYHRDVVGDFLDVRTKAPYTQVAVNQQQRRCQKNAFGCTGPGPSQAVCTALATTTRTNMIAQLIAGGAPQAAASALTVSGTVDILIDNQDDGDSFLTVWGCDLTIAKEVFPGTAQKPVCGAGGGVPPTQPFANGISYDEVSLWDYPLTLDEFAKMVDRYQDNPANVSLPARPSQALPNSELATGLPVHMLDAVSSELDLLVEYISAERSVMYGECFLGGPSDSRARTLDRVGRNLRLATLIESEAARLADLPGVANAAWRPRYDAVRKQIQGRRSKVLQAIKDTSRCENPLGVREQDLPLFVGQAVGADAKFFASSRYLAGEAEREINLAAGLLGEARTAYVNQRLGAYQLSQFRETKEQRTGNIRASYESVLRRYCGTPAGSQTLLSSFLAGTMDASSCLFKTELPACVDAAQKPIGEIAPTCLRGALGELVMSIQKATLDATNARNAKGRATAQYDADRKFCADRQRTLDHDEDMTAAHNQNMQDLRQEEHDDYFIADIFHAAMSLDTGTIERTWDQYSGYQWDHFIPLERHAEVSARERQERERASYELMLQAQSHELDIEDCNHRADTTKFSIDAATDVLTRSELEFDSATRNLQSAANEIAGIVQEADGQLSIEAAIDSTPPHLHYWLNQKIDDYQRHLAYARRLTYLAVRAVEYEAQQSIAQRTPALIAPDPEGLRSVLRVVNGLNAPIANGIALTIGDRRVALSLRDEILKLGALNAAPGLPDQTPEEVLKRYLRSDASKVFDDNGNYLGRGIRFTLRPDGFTETSCAERLWRVQASLSMQLPQNQLGLVLHQENAFGSQSCTQPFGTVEAAASDPATNVLLGDTTAFSTAAPTKAVNIEPVIALDHRQLEALPESNISGFAGRGLYADYVLLFPPLKWTDADVQRVSDVLIRFDFVEAVHAASPQH